MDVWNLLQDEILGMKWLNRLLGEGLSRLGLDITGRLGGSVQFFLYDVLKITVLLCCLIFVISYGSTAQFGKSIRPKILPHTKVIKGREYCMYFLLL